MRRRRVDEPPRCGPTTTVPTASSALQALAQHLQAAAATNDETQFAGIAEAIARDLPQGLHLLRLVHHGHDISLVTAQLQAGGLVPPGREAYVAKFLAWIRTSWTDPRGTPPATAAPAPVWIQTRCPQCGAGWDFDRAEELASNPYCGAETPSGPCPGILQRI